MDNASEVSDISTNEDELKVNIPPEVVNVIQEVNFLLSSSLYTMVFFFFFAFQMKIL